jgi:hypothetical protein
MRRSVVASVVASALLGASGRAAAADDVLACVSAAEAAQRQRAAGKLLQARASLQICSRDVCPGVIRSDCTRWRAEVEASVPTIVLRAQDARGRDLTDVKVSLDGAPIADKIDGFPIEVDPGQHVLTGEHAGSKRVRQEIVIRTGDRNRTIAFPFEDLEPAPGVLLPPLPPPPARPSPAAWIFAGVGVASAGVGTFFLVSAIRDRNELEATCKPTCAQSKVDAGQRNDDIATVAYGAAILSGGLATYFFLTPTKHKPTALPSREVLVTPLLGGAFATWSERF